MRFLSIEKVEPSMVLCRPVYDGDMNLLLGANKTLTSTNIKRIKSLGFKGVYVYDNFHDNDDIQDIISPETILEAARAVKNVDIEAAMYYSNRIVDDLISAKDRYIQLVELKTYDDYTYRHCVNVAVLSCIIGFGMNLSHKKLVQLALSGLLHDIGKSKIPDEILNKPERLTNEEFEIMKSHTELGYEMVKDNTMVSSLVKTGIKFHHENIDGSGYYGKKGNEIPLFARIIHVADVYDALVSKRPYKKALQVSEALEYLMGACGTLFDKTCVEIFLKYITPYPIGAEVTLSNEEKGIVIRTNKNALQRPVIKCYDGEEIDLLKVLNVTITDSSL